MRALCHSPFVAALVLVGLCACGVQSEHPAPQQDHALPPGVKPGANVPELALPQDVRRDVQQRTSSMWVKIQERQSRDDGKRYRLRKFAVQINRGAAAPDHGVKISRLHYHADEEGKWKTVNPSASGPGNVSVAELPADLDFSKHYFVEATLYDGSGKVSRPAAVVHTSYKYLDYKGFPILPLEVG